jgi:hypothetical protein
MEEGREFQLPQTMTDKEIERPDSGAAPGGPSLAASLQIHGGFWTGARRWLHPPIRCLGVISCREGCLLASMVAGEVGAEAICLVSSGLTGRGGQEAGGAMQSCFFFYLMTQYSSRPTLSLSLA